LASCSLLANWFLYLFIVLLLYWTQYAMRTTQYYFVFGLHTTYSILYTVFSLDTILKSLTAMYHI